MRTTIQTLITYFIIGIVGFFCFFPCFFVACLPASWRYENRIFYWCINFFYRTICWATFLPITIRGKENLPKQPAIFVANHQSSLDIPLLGRLMHAQPHVWLFLAKFAKIPVLGFIARRMNVIVDHRGIRRLVGSLKEVLMIIHHYKTHVLLFPEGGRYIDGTIHHFFYGFAILAKETNRPVIPVMIRNINKVYPPGAFLIRQFPVSITIGKPFILNEGESEDAFVQRVHAWFVAQTTE